MSGARPVCGHAPYAIGDMNAPISLERFVRHAVWVRHWSCRMPTPRECERLQGFPDDYTDVPYRRRNWPPDGPRYKALGNSMAVNVMNWLGERIALVDDIQF